MKKILFLSIASVFLFSCTSDSTVAEENVAPTVPTLVSPTNNKLCISNSVSFQWNASVDAENNAVLYIIEVSKSKDFSRLVMTTQTSASYLDVTLEKATAYYWRVKAIDGLSRSIGSSSDYSPVFSFYTSGEGVVNYLPFLPDLVSPKLNEVLSTKTAQLKWTAQDVDTKDKLVYDVYFGTAALATEKVAENIETPSFDVPVASAKNYFWKVVVKDGKGGETEGQTWRFRTN